MFSHPAPVADPDSTADKQAALLAYQTRLRRYGLSERSIKNHVALPHGARVLAALTRYLPRLHACGFSNPELSEMASQAVGPMNMQLFGQSAPKLRKLGWAKADIIQLAITPHGAQGLKELAQFAPELLARNFLPSILLSCAQTPGALQILTSMQPPSDAARPAVGTAPESPVTRPTSVLEAPRVATPQVFEPLAFSLAELNSIRRKPNGETVVFELNKFSGLLDSSRLDRKKLLIFVTGPDSDTHLRRLHQVAPAFADRGVSLTDVFNVAICPGGPRTLKSLDDLYAPLLKLNFSPQMQVSMATRTQGHRWLEALVQHTLAVSAMGWTQRDVLHLARLSEAPKVLNDVRMQGQWLHAMGFSPLEQAAFVKLPCSVVRRQQIKELWPKSVALGYSREQLLTLITGTYGADTLAAVVACGPKRVGAGFSLQQMAHIVKKRTGIQALQTLHSFAAALVSFGFTPEDLTLLAREGEGAKVYMSLLNCSSQLIDDGIAPSVLLRAAGRKDGTSFLATIGQYWRPLRATGFDAQHRLMLALAEAHTAASFELWMVTSVTPAA